MVNYGNDIIFEIENLKIFQDDIDDVFDGKLKEFLLSEKNGGLTFWDYVKILWNDNNLYKLRTSNKYFTN